MEERNDGGGEKLLDEVMLPGFRFHPTDEELVGFYLKRKIQQQPLTIELIKQLDIYKYDPWDLPKLATTGEKEWYFYCPRDRKYRNSARPNRVTRAGFWKATGTDRPICSSLSSEGNNSSNKCIGLKKSLVFYKGRAAKGVKTDWMMHEFRLPSLADSFSPKKYLVKTNIPANESWAICRIFKKTNSTAAQRAFSHSWVSSLPEPNTTADNNMLITQKNSLHSQFCSNTNDTTNTISNLSPFDINYPLLHRALFDHHHNHLPPFSNVDLISNNNNSLVFSSSPLLETSNNTNPKSTVDDVSSMLLNNSQVSSNFGGGLQDQCGGGGYYQMQETIIGNNINNYYNVAGAEDQDDDDLETLRCVGFQFGMPNFNIGDEWKSNLVHWDACDIVPSSYSTTKCYTSLLIN